MGTGFTWETQNREADIEAASAVWQESKRMLADPSYDLVVLDEITYMLAYHYLDTQEVIAAIENRPPRQNVIVTGRGCHARLLELAGLRVHSVLRASSPDRCAASPPGNSATLRYAPGGGARRALPGLRAHSSLQSAVRQPRPPIFAAATRGIPVNDGIPLYPPATS